ncbi:MAG: TAT-variant-translocated molybdopterin oxidoreductase [Planctomycetota bacterium]
MTKAEATTGKQYWRSLDELAETPEFRRFVEYEFPGFAGHLSTASTRRHFLKVMGASFALAGMGSMTGCLRWPEQKIVPFAHRPEGFKPGIPVQFATSMEVGGVARPVLATSFDGRPIKIEGNPQHPLYADPRGERPFGPATAWMQASVLELYDPDRSHQLFAGGAVVPKGWADPALLALVASVRSGNRQNFAVLAEASSSPTLERLRDAVGRDRWFEYEPLSRDSEREGTVLAFGKVRRTHYAFDKADVVVSLGADFLMTHPASLRYAYDFAKGRRGQDGRMSRLHVVEGNFTITGSSADHRYPVAPSLLPAVAARLAHELRGLGVAVAGVSEATEFGTAADAFAAGIRRMAQDLQAHRGKSVVLAGPDQPPAVHALALAMNAALDNFGQTVFVSDDVQPERRSHVTALRELVTAMNQDRIQTLVILGANPVYDAPADVGFAEALAKVPQSLHLSYYYDETSKACKWHLPRAHYLEAWGDARSWDGTHCLVQPLIQPLTEVASQAKSPIEVVSLFLEEKPRTGYELVRAEFAHRTGGMNEAAWEQALHDGFVAATAFPRSGSVGVVGTSWLTPLRESNASAPADGQVDLVFAPDYKVLDGRFANNGWLQELPDPMTKITWDNAAIMGPATASKRGVQAGQMIRLSVGQGDFARSIEIPVHVMPGLANDTVVLPLGYARNDGVFSRPVGFVSYAARTAETLKVATGTGFPTYALRSASVLWGITSRATVARAAGTYEIASTQDHHSIQLAPGQEGSRPAKELAERQTTILVRGDYADYKKDPGHFVAAVKQRKSHGGHATAEHHDDSHGHGDRATVPHQVGHASEENRSLWKEHEYHNHKWGMAIDLSTCIGCSACVTACQAENNIGVVGKEEVARGREMHWIRIDRYFSGDDPAAPEQIQAMHQPVTCQQCENAPCESVCPVAATVHSEEGLNDMVYNRCIGTRYCSNNCPYKVRRFNYFNNFKEPSETEKLVYNPEVTVRNRGVMEKCTFCVQRIQNGKIAAKNEGRSVRDGEIVPACGQTCPTQSIVFGDLNDPESQVSKLHHDHRSYTLLEDLNVKPRNRFQAKLSNPMGDQS